MKIKMGFRRMIMMLFLLGVCYISLPMVSNALLIDAEKTSQQKPTVIGMHPMIKGAIQQKKLQEDFITHEKLITLSKETKHTKRLEDVIDLEKYSRETVVATGYTAGIESTGKTPDHPEYGITYSGVDVKRDLYSTIAADLNVYPIGTIMYIPDYGYGVVADKGSAITGNKIDLYYHTVEDVYALWGKRELDVYIIEMGDGTLTEHELTALNENETLQVFREQLIE